MRKTLFLPICMMLGVTFWFNKGVYAQAVPPLSAVTPTPIYKNPNLTVEMRVTDLFQRLTQDEKLSILTLEAGDPQRLNTQPVKRLDMPPLWTSDAPQGVRNGQSTAFPTSIVMASTWDPPLIGQIGAAIAQEAKARNRQVIYGPDINIARSPQGGRDFEEFGEDPYLSAQTAIGYVNGMQSQNVASCPKHFVCNDQEFHRHDINIQVDERALHEIYLPPFQAALEKAHAWAVMPSISQVNGTWMAHNKPLLTDLVKTAWHWDGLVISDWGGLRNTPDAANAGTDIEMPAPKYFSASALTDALAKNQITQANVDDKVRRLLRIMVRTGLLDGPKTLDPNAVNSPAHQKLALKVAQEGIVLLKNDRAILPLNRSQIKHIAVIGPNAQDTQLGGRWSADVNPYYSISIVDGIKKAVGTGVTVDYALGCPRTTPGKPENLSAATALAAKSDVAIVVVGMDNNYEGEELDPPNISLPGDQDKLIQAIAAANKNTIVVLNQGTPILMDKWLNHVPGLIESWYAGQEQGNGVAGILFGEINPSGKLPQTIGMRREDYSDFSNYPGDGNTMTYTEGVYVGYRHFDQAKITPLFPFGYGLSYTTFQYSNLHVPRLLKRGQPATVKVTIENTGRRSGDEIVQLYVHDLAPKVDRPIQELKSFQRVSLKPGQKTVVTLPFDANAFAYWDSKTHAWKTNPGQYEIGVGASSRDIRQRGTIRVQ